MRAALLAACLVSVRGYATVPDADAEKSPIVAYGECLERQRQGETVACIGPDMPDSPSEPSSPSAIRSDAEPGSTPSHGFATVGSLDSPVPGSPVGEPLHSDVGLAAAPLGSSSNEPASAFAIDAYSKSTLVLLRKPMEWLGDEWSVSRKLADWLNCYYALRCYDLIRSSGGLQNK